MLSMPVWFGPGRDHLCIPLNGLPIQRGRPELRGPIQQGKGSEILDTREPDVEAHS